MHTFKEDVQWWKNEQWQNSRQKIITRILNAYHPYYDDLDLHHYPTHHFLYLFTIVGKIVLQNRTKVLKRVHLWRIHQIPGDGFITFKKQNLECFESFAKLSWNSNERSSIIFSDASCKFSLDQFMEFHELRETLPCGYFVVD